MPEKPITTLAAFIEKIKELTAQGNRKYAFRGEASSEWALYPGLMRDGYERLWANERKATRDLISVHPSEFREDHTMFDRLVRMQHFGLPTRLLDVTLNPLVALFNATEKHTNAAGTPQDGKLYRFSIPDEYQKYYDSDTISCLSNLANMSADECQFLFDNNNIDFKEYNDVDKHKIVDRLVQFVRGEKPSFRARIVGQELVDCWYVIPKLSNRRIIAQSGAFIIFGLTRTPMRYHRRAGIAHRHILIPETSKENLRNELASLGITESTLFPEIDKAAKLVRNQYVNS